MSAPTGNITAWADMKGGAVFAIRAPGPHGDVLAISYSNNEQLTNLISVLQTIRGPPSPRDILPISRGLPDICPACGKGEDAHSYSEYGRICKKGTP